MAIRVVNLVYTVIIAVLLGVVIYLYFNNMAKDKLIASQKRNVDRAVTIIERVTDTVGREHVIYDPRTQRITKEEAKELPIAATLDTIAIALGIQAKQIEDWQRIAITSQAKELKAQEVIDSLKKRSRFEFRNRWIELGYEPGDIDPLTGMPRPGAFNYKYRLELNSTQYNAGKWWENKPRVDVFANDTNAVINGIDRYTIEPKQSLIHGSIRQYNTYNQGSGHFASGLQVEVNIKRLNLQAGRLYNFTTGNFENRYGLGFSILRKR